MKKLAFTIATVAMMVMVGGCSKPDPGTKPTVVTDSAKQITINSASIGGIVTDNGGHSITSCGIYYSATPDPGLNDKVANTGVRADSTFSATITDLESYTTYYYRAFAGNELGQSIGEVRSFTTKGIPSAAIESVFDINLTGASIKISIIPNGETVEEAGLCFSTSSNPTTSDNKITTDQSGVVTLKLTDLTSNTKYYARAFIKTTEKTTYSPENIIWPYALTDMDGNGYHTVDIGEQTWMVENWKCTRYNNGDLIPNVYDYKAWSDNSGEGLTTGARCYYNNDSANYNKTYGCLYNGYVMNDSRGFAPQGWSLPTMADVGIITNYLGGYLNCGGPMKETGTEHWHAPNTGATNSSGFNALPAGYRSDTWESMGGLIGVFNGMGDAGVWWEKDEVFGSSRFKFYLGYDDTEINAIGATSKSFGFAVRLIKDK